MDSRHGTPEGCFPYIFQSLGYKISRALYTFNQDFYIN